MNFNDVEQFNQKREKLFWGIVVSIHVYNWSSTTPVELNCTLSVSQKGPFVFSYNFDMLSQSVSQSVSQNIFM